MAEKSLMWTTGALGDGLAEYTMAELTRWLRQTYLSDNTDEGILKNYGGALAVSGVASPVSIAAGGALVYGFPYWLTAATTMAIPSPAGAVRIDRVVLSADWVTQTVRLERVAGAEGGAAPALTQVDGTEWQISLAQCSITVGGVITITDERTFLHPNWEIEAAQLGDDLDGDGIQGGDGAAFDIDVSDFVGAALSDDGAENIDVNLDGTTIELGAGGLQIVASGLDASHIANRTRTLFVPATFAYNNTTAAKCAYTANRGWECPDDERCYVRGSFRVPSDFSSGLNLIPYGTADGAGTGDVYARLIVYYAADGEAYDTHGSNTGYAGVTINKGSVYDALDTTYSLVGASIGDTVIIEFYRDGNDVGDTVNDTVYAIGFYVYYTADM